MHQQNILFIGGPAHLSSLLRQALPSTCSLQTEAGINHAALLSSNAVLVFQDEPNFNGLNLVQLLKHAASDTPVIMLGASGTPQSVVAEAFRMGASDFLFLPLEVETLLSCLFRLARNGSAPKPENSWLSRVQGWLFPKKMAFDMAISSGISPMKIQAPMVPIMDLQPKADLQVQMLGKFRLVMHGKEIVRLPGKKARSVLAYLLQKHPHSVHREELIDKFWNGSTLDSARNCLNVTLHAIRKCFEDIAPEEQIIVFRDECYSISPEILVELDIDLFESYWKKARQLETEGGMEAAVNTYHQAFAFYRGDLLEDLPYEEWAELSRERLRETWLVIVDRLSKHFFDLGKWQISLNLCKMMLTKDPCLEDSHRRLMACYMRLGMKDLAVRQFQKCNDALKSELSVVPGKATMELYAEIRAA